MHTMAALPRGDESILLVEPDPETRVLAVFMLDRLGYRVMEARNGPAAISASESAIFDLVVTEAVMSGLNGHDLAGLLQERQPKLRALFLADPDYERLARKAAARRGVRFLCRPFTMATLAQAVREALDARPVRTVAAGNS
jgi:CheY-like chemotaxis protein